MINPTLYPKTCPVCNIEFMGQRAHICCSIGCAALRRRRPRKHRACIFCGADYIPTHGPQKYCSYACNNTARDTGTPIHLRADKRRIRHILEGMIRRCNDPATDKYRDYGARGISICEEWASSFAAFFEWALANGYRNDLKIERINNDGPYSPENCRWATQFEQSRNTRQNRWITAWGETKCVTDWTLDSRSRFASTNSILSRLNAGFSPEDAIAGPPRSTSRKATSVS